MADANVSEPWRKNFACRPYEDDPGDVERFIKELPSALDDYDADKEYTCGQVLVGDHEGGNGPNATPFHGNAAAQRAQLRKCEKRQRKVAAKLKYHCLTESTKAALDAAAPNDGEAMWAHFVATLQRTPTELTAEELKSTIRNCTILGTVGFVEDSLGKFHRHLDSINSKIRPAADQMSEHERAVCILTAISKTGTGPIAFEANKELARAGAQRLYQQPNAGVPGAGNPAAGARSIAGILAAFKPLWDADIKNGAITTRAAGGHQPTAGHSTRADGHEAVAQPLTLCEEVEEEELSLLRSVWESLPSTGQLRDAFVNAINAAPDRISRERICFNCFGWGHEKAKCPSPSMKLYLKAFLVLITALVSKGGSGRIPVPPVGASSSTRDGSATNQD